jgi:RNA polymerase sigma-70 factor (ECF subfamily)
MDPTPASPSVDEDAVLVARTAAGDEEAFVALVRRHHGRIHALARHLCGHAEDAEDLTQETFLRALGAAGGFTPRGRVGAWLRTILRNAFLDHRRRRRRRAETPWEDAPTASLASTRPGPDATWESHRRQARLDAALRRLAPPERLAFVLSEIDGLSYREIAAICDCAEGTVASRKHAAVSRLRRWLKEDLP